MSRIFLITILKIIKLCLKNNLLLTTMEIPISNRSNIIVAADDFGISERATRNILFLISLGKIDRVSVMINGVYNEKEISELIRSGVKIDIHLDIAFLQNDAQRKNVSSIYRLTHFCWNFILGKATSKKIKQEWTDQINKFHEVFGKYPDGINSHEHLHLFPPYFKIILSLQQQYSIPYVRLGSNDYKTYGSFNGMIISLLKHLNIKAFITSPSVSSEHLVSLDWIRNLKQFLSKLPDGKTEIVCHPEKAEEFVLMKEEF